MISLLLIKYIEIQKEEEEEKFIDIGINYVLYLHQE